MLGFALVRCGGSTAGGGTRDASSDAIAVAAGDDDARSDAMGGGDAACPESQFPGSGGGACWCDPSNPCQPCCPAMTDAAACFILPSDYDTSCTVDSDCVAVQYEPNWCVSECMCGGGTINRNSATQYEQATAATPLGSGAIAPAECGCTAFSGGPCCAQGQCTFGGPCPSPPADGGIVDAALADSPSGSLDFTVLCVGDAGPVDGGSPAEDPAVPGVSRWCNGAEVCTPFNGGWECCILMSAGVSFCLSP